MALMKKILITSFVFIISCSGTLPTIDSTEPTTTNSIIPIEEQLLIKDKKEGKKGVVRIVAKGLKVEESNDNKLVKTQGDSSGSGFFISTDGFIVTNNHVVGGAVTIDVYIGEERNSYNATIVGTSECDDIAVLKIDLPFGGAFYFEFDEINPVLGQDILAIGFPRGDEQITYLNGIISKEKAEGSNQWSSIDYAFEHTAEILPGSSGGPIINEFGKVVGIAYKLNSARQEFGIPSTVVKNTINKIIDNTFNKTLGANGEQLVDYGMYIYSAEPGSPFDEAGFDGGELITHINGLDITKENTMDVYCSALQTRGDSAAINFKGYDIDEMADFKASVSLDGTKANFEFINSTTTTKPTTTTSTTLTKGVTKPYFSDEALRLYIDSFQTSTSNRDYYRFIGDKNVGIMGTPLGDDYETLNQVVNDLSNLIPTLNLTLIDGVGDITYYFLNRSSYLDTDDIKQAQKYWYGTGYRIGNELTERKLYFKIGDHYKEDFDNANEQTVKDCRTYHLRSSFLWSLTGSPRDADGDKFTGNNYFSGMYCNEYQKISDLDRQVLLIHHSEYLSDATTIDEVYNLLK
jgi:S1-C subfamily serine protease